jgi:poly(ribitol-phosphate) beta-N-acetylglucosaminyltransferase
MTQIGPVRVSLIIPVYNPGRYLEPCIASILDQSMAPGSYEVVFVDDGSTDGSPARLDALAAGNPHVRVIHQPNSGWPGKPRNVGVDAARGEYVFFADHDDLLGREALSRLYAMATRCGSDVVLGKMAGQGRGAPYLAFHVNRDRATLWDSRIVSALTPHKLFRRAFLLEHGLRFPEGRRRLEDQHFVMRAYFAADVISILADYTCYYHVQPERGANAASSRYDPAGAFDPVYYFPFLEEVLSIVEANAQPGRQREELLRRFVTHEIMRKLTGSRLLRTPPGERPILLREIRRVVDAHVPTTLDSQLAPLHRTRLALVRANRLDLLVSLARFERDLEVRARVTSAGIDDGIFRVALSAELVAGGRPLTFERRNDSSMLPLPPEVAAAVPDDLRAFPAAVGVHVTLRRQDGAEIEMPTATMTREPDGSERRRLAGLAEAAIDLADPAEAHGLARNRWDVKASVAIAGYSRETLLSRPAGPGRARQVALIDGRLGAPPASWTVVTGARAAAVRKLSSLPIAGRAVALLRRTSGGRGHGAGAARA